MKETNLETSISLRLAGTEDATLLHQLKYQSFEPLYLKYQDDETSPTKEPIDKLKAQLAREDTNYYLIEWNKIPVGGVRVKQMREKLYQLSPIYLIPEYQNRGIGGKVIDLLFAQYSDAVTWRLDTIKQEKGNRYLYEKKGFIATGKERPVNEKMTLMDYEKVGAEIRLYEDSDADAVAGLIRRNFLEVNSKDYGREAAEEMVQSHDAAWVRKTAEYATIYLFCLEEQIVGCGAISSYWGSPDESILLLVFVLPDFHGLGIGRKILQTLEQDELFLRAKRVEIPASITAAEFYRKFGYDWKNGCKELDEEGHYRLEKFRKADK